MSLSIRGARLRVGCDADAFDLDVPKLDLASGSLTALIGPSGSGKTTVLEMAALLHRPAALEQFQVAGAEVRSLALRASPTERARFRAAHISYTVQSGGVLPFLTGRENAFAGLRVAGLAVDRSARIRLERIAQALGMAAALDKHRSQLSGGERRRIGLIRALVAPRPLVLVDEPTSALDGESADRAIESLSNLAEEFGSTVLIATHDEWRVRDAGFAVHELSTCSRLDKRLLQPLA